jgi:hypothetical protein
MLTPYLQLFRFIDWHQKFLVFLHGVVLRLPMRFIAPMQCFHVLRSVASNSIVEQQKGRCI